MKTIAIHSHKGGVGKTTVGLLLAKHAATAQQKVCLLDFDFLGTGMADLFAFRKLPRKYLEAYFLSSEPENFGVDELVAVYADDDMGGRGFEVILNLQKGLPKGPTARSALEQEQDFVGLLRNEPHYKEFRHGVEILLSQLKERGTELVIMDCHPGLSFVSETVQRLSDTDVYLTTPNRADCFGLLKQLNLKGLDLPTSILVLNKAESPVIDLASFRQVMESDGVVGVPAKALFSLLKHIGRKERHFAAVPKSERLAVVPESDRLRRAFYIGGSGLLPPIDPNQSEFRFCEKVLSLG